MPESQKVASDHLELELTDGCELPCRDWEPTLVLCKGRNDSSGGLEMVLEGHISRSRALPALPDDPG